MTILVELPPDPHKTNNLRAKWAKEAFDHYFRDIADKEFDEINLAVLICNLRHLADRHDVSWERVIEHADHSYKMETTATPTSGD